MAISITIDGTTYLLPENGNPPPWGSDLSDIIVALANAVANSTGPGDINTTTFVVPNNQSSPLPVTGLFFDQSTIRSAQVNYSIDLSTNTQELVENGTLFLNYNSTTNTWNQSQFSNGFSGIVFSISAGQVAITSPNVTGSSYAGSLKFNARALEIFS